METPEQMAVRRAARREAIREAARLACVESPDQFEDPYTVIRELPHLGNETVSVSFMVERDEPLPESEWEPGVDLEARCIGHVIVKPGDDVALLHDRFTMIFGEATA